MPAIEQAPATSAIGRDTRRVDGPLKVTGKAQYTSDFHFPGLLYGVPVEATIAKGKVVKLDTAAAEKMPGARGIGEIGLAGVAAAITAAVHHATGVRVRELPVKIEDLLA